MTCLKKQLSLFALILTSLLSPIDLALACTRILNADNAQAVLVGRTMDWYQDIKTNLSITFSNH